MSFIEVKIVVLACMN